METQGIYIISMFVAAMGLLTLIKVEGKSPKNLLIGLAWLIGPFIPVFNTFLALGFIAKTLRIPFYAVLFAIHTMKKRVGGVA